MLHFSQARIDNIQVRVPKNLGYDFIYKPPKPPYGYVGVADDMKD